MKVTPKPQRARTDDFPGLVRAFGGQARLAVKTDVGVQTINAAGRGVMPGRLAQKALALALDLSVDELRACIDRSDGWMTRRRA